MTAFDSIISARDGREAAPHIKLATLAECEAAIAHLAEKRRGRPNSIIMTLRQRANYLRGQPNMAKGKRS